MRQWLLVGAMTLVAFGAAAQTDIVINELYYDTPGTDAGEFVELKGQPGMSLDGYTIVGVNGNGGVDYRTVDLTGFVMPADGYFVVAQDNTVPNYDLIDNNTWQNGADEVELRLDGLVIDSVCYGSSPDLVCEGDPAPDVSGQSLSRCPDGVDTNNNLADFLATSVTTPGETNDCGGPPPPTDVTLCQLKENDADGVPVLLGERVRVTDIVALVGTGVFRAPGTGLLIHVYQDAPGDPCCTALFDGNYDDVAFPIAEGDQISEVIGTVAQFNGLTEISNIEVLTIAGPGTTPNPIEINANELSTNGEIYESCLIEICGLFLDPGATWPGEGSNAPLTVLDAFGTTTMFVDRDTDVDGSAQPIEPFTVTGIASQFDSSLPYDSGYQIIPRRRADILDDTGCPVPTEQKSWSQIKNLYR